MRRLHSSEAEAAVEREAGNAAAARAASHVKGAQTAQALSQRATDLAAHKRVKGGWALRWRWARLVWARQDWLVSTARNSSRALRVSVSPAVVRCSRCAAGLSATS